MDNKIKLRLNPQGFAVDTHLYYRIPLSQKQGILWESTHLDLGLLNTISPSFEMLSAYIQFEPIAFFDITIKAGIEGEFGVLGYGVYRLPSKTSPTDHIALTKYTRGDFDPGFALSIVPRLKLALGPVILVHEFQYDYYSFPIDHQSLYTYKVDSRFFPQDHVFVNATYLLYKLSDQWIIGLNYYITTIPSHDEYHHRGSVIANYDWHISGTLSLDTTVLGGYYLYHENHDLFFALQTALKARL